jgi:hypothetical protein
MGKQWERRTHAFTLASDQKLLRVEAFVGQRPHNEALSRERVQKREDRFCFFLRNKVMGMVAWLLLNRAGLHSRY